MSDHSTTHRIQLALAAALAVPLGASVASGAAHAASKHRSASTRTFYGPVEYVDHGPVQVSIKVKNRKIVSVGASISPQEPRSVQLQGMAVPILRQETLRAQNARINAVSGATDTSYGYIESLQAAVKAAERAKALR